VNCIAILRRVIGPIGGAWIPYTAAQVVARRAAQMVLVVVCTAVPLPPSFGPVPVPPAAVYWPRVELVHATPHLIPQPVHDVSAPGVLGVFGLAVAWLVWRRT